MTHQPSTQLLNFTVNGRAAAVTVDPMRRLADVLREDLGLTGTKIGCNAGDCGACTVLLDGRQVCSCLVPAAQAAGHQVRTVEGLGEPGNLSRLQQAFLDHGAAQCGICTPGMLMAAQDLLDRQERPAEQDVLDALGGVLCRCTGYRKIVEAVLAVAQSSNAQPDTVDAGRADQAVGARMAKVDGVAKITGVERYGADDWPDDSLMLRIIRSPHHHARFRFGDLAGFAASHGLTAVLTAADVPGQNIFGVYPTGKDQPVFADGYTRFRGEALCALVGEDAAVAAIADSDLPISWEVLPPLHGIEAALASGAAQLHGTSPGNVLVSGRLHSGDPAAALSDAAIVVRDRFRTAFVEHAYIEPEAGYARRVGDRLEIFVTTQTPYMDRDEVALIMGLRPEQVRIIPSAVGGGFGGKLDLSLHPMIAIAAWKLNRPVRCIYSRPESMASTTKRHPAVIDIAVGADRDGRLKAITFEGDFNTGAYASWGPTVANRVPVHASGPYAVGAITCVTRAIYTNDTPAGAFRGFGVPQSAIALETLLDDIAERLNTCPFELRYRNALDRDSITASGQRLAASVGLRACLDTLRPQWQQWRAETAAYNKQAAADPAARLRRGVGVGCGWYGIGNTSLPNPSIMRVGLRQDGRLVLYNGAVDIGQGSNTIMMQICADALGVPVALIDLVAGDTDLTADAGKTSASRQTFVSGTALRLASEDLRRQMLRLANIAEPAQFRYAEGRWLVSDGQIEHQLNLSRLPTINEHGDLLLGEGRFDPPTSPLDADGQGVPYATYSFSAQLALVEVDIDLGTTKVLRIAAAADVGRAINPTQVEGQLHGGVAQGLGLALMEEYIPGRTENLHDYLIPTIGDIPPIDTYIVEDPEPLGPFGAKGIGEPALVPTAPAILNAIRHATGARMTQVPATPDRLRTALRRVREAAE
ncbi:MAG TPA: molybdopterin cofactor-binding domain-containing protein [Dongiaceae bacterium]|nr:molybdopterin cofactor-binding domain-containing protein [Dongiaceae bacterium]